ncbi:AAA domain-containing protein [uncultured Brachyspira sp.]|uniref:AAA domain-containing protein n=1 Tax=uncultured Brachyspira sp. TaxID=221953 RepID=UPI00260D7AF2|nr:AAA domain-containing protein [uncultured Brachyspira sp.]
MRIEEINYKNIKSIICRYTTVNQINLEYKLKKRIYFTMFLDNLLVSFAGIIRHANNDLIYRHRKMSFLRYEEADFLENKKANDIDLIEIYLDNDSDLNYIKNVMRCRNYLAYIDSFEKDYLVIIIKEYDAVKNTDLSLYYRMGKLDIYKSDFVLQNMHSDEDYILIAQNKDSYYLVGNNKYLKLNNIDGVYYIADFNTDETKAIDDIDDYLFNLYYGKHNFYNVNKYSNAIIETSNIEEINISYYLQMWDKYEELSLDLVLNSFTEAGYLSYNDILREDTNTIEFALSDNTNIENFIKYTSDARVDYLFVSSENVYNKIIEELQKTTFDNSVNGKIKQLEVISKNTSNLTLLGYNKKLQPNSRSIILDKTDENFNFNLNKSGYIFVSVKGSGTMHRRRVNARDKIITGKSSMPDLYKILSEDKSYNPPIRDKYIPPITDKILKNVFKYSPPTENQMQAIEIALNTPDIALIQGPPGTGKTTVVTAILSRLAEIAGDSKRNFADDLVSAYQHDAVNNCIERLGNFGLPTIEIGDKDSDVFMAKINKWLNEKIQSFEKEFPEVIEKTKIKDINDKIISFLSMRDIQIDTCENLLKEILSECSDISIELKNDIIVFLNSISAKELRLNADNNIINLIYNMPTTEIGYQDNGINIFTEIINYLKINKELMQDIIIQKSADFLEKFILDPSDCKYLRVIKNNLLSKFIIKPSTFLNDTDKNTLFSILKKVLEELKANVYDNKENIDDVFYSYYYSLINDKYHIIDSIKDYCFIVGATNQKANSHFVWKQKEANDLLNTNDNKYYDNILLDEAARSNPMDLMIPLSLAKNRIIIVGDHRQLPHLVEDVILENLEKNENFSKEDLKRMKEESMFEHLFNVVKELEKRDNIKRTITLNTQYRTHRILGEFVSKVFYEKNGDPKISSPRKDEEFYHNLPTLNNKPCAWINIDNKIKETKINTGGFTRKAEAIAIAKHIKMLLDSEDGKNYTFGVITFYKKQVELICKVFEDYKILVKSEGVYRASSKYTNNIVLVGSVDAFQGREFDVVYLSAVRSNHFSDNRNYGFLQVESRLCVSMSRQKRVLISAGDLDMFDNEIAKEKVNGLYEFVQLCKDNKNGVVIDGNELS